MRMTAEEWIEHSIPISLKLATKWLKDHSLELHDYLDDYEDYFGKPVNIKILMSDDLFNWLGY